MKRKTILIPVLLLALLLLAVLYFVVPRPVVNSPDTAVISSIVIQRHPHYQKGPEDEFVWTPKTAEEQAVAKEIVAYLAHSQETRTLRLEPALPPLDWKCMYIVVGDARQNSIYRERCLILGPGQFAPSDEPEKYHDAINLSCHTMGSGIWDRFQGNLKDPDGIRAFVLDALDLPLDFM